MFTEHHTTRSDAQSAAYSFLDDLHLDGFTKYSDYDHSYTVFALNGTKYAIFYHGTIESRIFELASEAPNTENGLLMRDCAKMVRNENMQWIREAVRHFDPTLYGLTCQQSLFDWLFKMEATK